MPASIARIQQQERIDIRRVSDEILQVHGVLPGRKDDGIVRLLYENANGIPNRLGGNEKLDKAKELIDKLGAEVIAYNEHRQNLRHKDNRNGWNQLFRGGESDVRSIVAHNIHEADKIGRVQEGGTGLLMFGPITEYLDMPASEKDRSGLGRWTTMLLKGSSGVQTRIICGYNPCKVTARITAQVTLNNDGTRIGKGTTSHARESNLERIWENF